MNKTKRLYIRISQNDLALLEKQANKNKINNIQLIETLNKANAMHLKILLEISRVTGNINQIAYHLNSEKMEKKEALDLFLKEAQNTKDIFSFLRMNLKSSLFLFLC